MFPSFPTFAPLRLSSKEAYDKFYGQFAPLSDLSFGNLMVWLNQYHDLRVTSINGNMAVECHNMFEDGHFMLTLLGGTDIDATLHSLFSYLADINEPQQLTLVSQTVVDRITRPEDFIITPERDNDNYILSAEKLSTLAGGDFGELRKQINRFEREYAGRFEVRELDIESPEVIQNLVNNIHIWDKIYTHNDLQRQEACVINTSLTYARELQIKCLAVLIDGSVQAVVMYQLVPQKGYVICNHMKVNFGYRNVSTYLTVQLAQLLHGRGIEYLNFEQDLGIEGLREHKLRLKPVDFIRSYSVAPAADNS